MLRARSLFHVFVHIVYGLAPLHLTPEGIKDIKVINNKVSNEVASLILNWRNVQAGKMRDESQVFIQMLAEYRENQQMQMNVPFHALLF